MVSSLCSLCKKAQENVMYLICECSTTKSLWHSLQKTFNSLLTLPPLDPIISIVGRWDIDNPNNVLVNHIVLLFKGFYTRTKVIRKESISLSETLHKISRKN